MQYLNLSSCLFKRKKKSEDLRKRGRKSIISLLLPTWNPPILYLKYKKKNGFIRYYLINIRTGSMQGFLKYFALFMNAFKIINIIITSFPIECNNRVHDDIVKTDIKSFMGKLFTCNYTIARTILRKYTSTKCIKFGICIFPGRCIINLWSQWLNTLRRHH